MNSILQCIFSTEVLMGYFISGAYKEDVNHGSPLRGQLANAFSDLVNEFSHGNHARVVYASKFKRAIELRTTQFSGNGQQDSQEFLRFMLDGLHEDLNRVTTRPKFTYKDADVDMLSDRNRAIFSWNRCQVSSSSFIFDIFGGQYESTVTCHTCHHKSRTFDTFWDLSLQIPRSSHESRSKSAASEKCCTLIDCLRAYSAEEELETPYNCEKCRSYQLASKSLRIYRCPEILVIHLKRFSNEMSRSAKIETNVLFPIENMSVNVALSTLDGHDTDMTYDLYGMSNHYGGLGGGHYVAYCKNVEDNTWYLRNDTVIQRICPENTSSVDLATAIRGAGSSAYVLFYKKRAKEV
ncbi:hypothetical protein BJ742DRAFT_759603 [Cladochytrium replicatum]|nr:hypothetical protein BJ742DRAFT_759603 [Cladochytrium replicatum]